MELIAVLFILIFFPTIFTKAPIFLSSKECIDKLASILPKDKSFRFIDLGCGIGHVLNHLSKKFPNGVFTGVELSPVLALIAAFLNRKNRNVSIRLTDLRRVNLNDFDYIYVFLSPFGNTKILDQVCALKGKIVISNSFPFETLKESKIIRGDPPLYIYIR